MINFTQSSLEDDEIPEGTDSLEVFDADHPWVQFEVPGHPNIRLCLRAKNDDIFAEKHIGNRIIGQYYVLGNGNHQPTGEDVEEAYHLAYEIVSQSTEGVTLRHPKSEFIITLATTEEIDRYLASLKA